MHRKRRTVVYPAMVAGVLASLAAFTVFSGLIGRTGSAAHSISVPDVRAADGQGEKYPYGGSQSGVYGEKKTVTTPGEARKLLRKYFSNKNVKIGAIRETDLYFEAEIRDRNNNLIDKVIVDKRTGRIRSIY